MTFKFNSKTVVLVLAEKGGVGKSTSSEQVIAPWILSRAGSARIVELDDVNTDAGSSWMSSSDIKTFQEKVGDYAEEAVMNAFLNNETQSPTVIDVGGNKTAQSVMTALGSQGMIDYAHLAIVPVRGMRDMSVGKQTIMRLKELRENLTIAVALCDVTDVSRVKQDYTEIFDDAQELGVPVVIIPRFRFLERSQTLNMTLFELSKIKGKLTMKADEDMRKHMESESNDRSIEVRTAARTKGLMFSLDQTAAELDKIFKELDKLVDYEHKPSEKKVAKHE